MRPRRERWRVAAATLAIVGVCSFALRSYLSTDSAEVGWALGASEHVEEWVEWISGPASPNEAGHYSFSVPAGHVLIDVRVPGPSYRTGEFLLDLLPGLNRIHLDLPPH